MRLNIFPRDIQASLIRIDNNHREKPIKIDPITISLRQNKNNEDAVIISTFRDNFTCYFVTRRRTTNKRSTFCN